MFINSFICGSSHRPVDDDDDGDDIDSCSPCSTPKRSKRSGSYKSKEIKNPYSDRGLEKFHALLAEVEDKKQKIYNQKGAEDISLVRFVSSNDEDGIKPVIVKAKEKSPEADDQKVKENHGKQISEAMDKQTIGNDVHQESGLEIYQERPEKKLCWTWNFKMKNLRKPCYYLPIIMILILLFLAIFGRSFSILFTSIGWYLIPSIKGGGSSTSRKLKRKKKKDYTRRLSENIKTVNDDGSSSPWRVITEPIDHMSPHRQLRGQKIIKSHFNT